MSGSPTSFATSNIRFNVWWSKPVPRVTVWIRGDLPQLEAPQCLCPASGGTGPFTATCFLPGDILLCWNFGVQEEGSAQVRWCPTVRKLWTSSSPLTTNVMLWGTEYLQWPEMLLEKVDVTRTVTLQETVTTIEVTRHSPAGSPVTPGGRPLRKQSSLSFFSHLEQQLERDYVLLVDRSVSMEFMGKWQEAQQAVEALSPYVCQCDPDGITLYLFDHQFVKWDNIISSDKVVEAFTSCPPRGSTDLAKVLEAAFGEHFAGSRRATTLLVITDGEPNSKPKTKDVIIEATRKVKNAAELRVSFVQIGDDEKATDFLRELDDELENEQDCPFDIVDTVNFADMAGQSFEQYLQGCLEGLKTSVTLEFPVVASPVGSTSPSTPRKSRPRVLREASSGAPPAELEGLECGSPSRRM